MFRWLTGLLTQKKKKDTEIRNLKQEIQRTVRECKRAADLGDPDATVRLREFEKTITEQSVRLTGHKKPPSTVILPPGAI